MYEDVCARMCENMRECANAMTNTRKNDNVEKKNKLSRKCASVFKTCKM